MDKAYTRKFQVHTYEVDFAGKAHLLAMLNYLQDAAGEHAAKLGFGIEELLKKNSTWLLSRYHIKVLRYPRWRERLEVSTWPSGKQGVFALRDFQITDERDECLLIATSSWILLNLEKKQPVRLEDFLPNRFTLDKRALKDDFQSLPQLEKSTRELPFQVLMKDLDFNRHVNNAVYIQWALEAVPPEILNSKHPVDIEVSYRAEAFYGDQVISRIQDLGREPTPAFLHQIVNKTSGVELTRLKTIWR